MTTKPVLEPAAQEFADATADPPYRFDLGPEKGRETVDEVQSGEIARPDVDITDISHEEAAKAVAGDSAAYEEVWRTGATRSFVGLRFDLAKVTEKRVQQLVEHAWRNKAPKRVVANYDAQAGQLESR
jgi:hypothetical protein